MAEKYDTAAIIESTNLVELVSRYVQLQKAGAEFKGLCPFHAEKSPSFTVSDEKKFYHCFGCGAHGDAINWLVEIEGIDFRESCKRLLNGSGTSSSTPPHPIAQREYQKPPKRITTPPPEGTPPPDMRVNGLGGAPSATWTYRTPEGAIWGYVARYETAEGKTIRVWSWGQRAESERPQWACGHFSEPRPLYNLHQLAKRPNAQILLCEGEKATDAAAALFPSMLPMTWPGGAQAIRYVDWSALRGRRVVLFPDNDEPGIECMGRIAVLLRSIASEVKGINVQQQPDGTDTPPKWDIADAVDWTPIIALEWAKNHVFTYPSEPSEPISDDANGQSDEISTHSAHDIPHFEMPPLEAYGDAHDQQVSADTDGHAETRQTPVKANLVGIYAQQHTGPQPTSASLGVISRRMSDVTIRAVDWLWYGKIPCGKVTGISGNPGLGKSQITASLAAVVSVGGKWPVTREPADRGSVLLLNAEDDADDTLGPRLIAAGADLSRIHIIDAIRVADERGGIANRGLDLVRDIDRISIKINEIGDVRLVIIDPVSAYMGGADSHKMADVVGIMARLKALASDTRCAIIMVNHLNKSAGQDALLKTQGSIGFVSHARAVWGVCKDKEFPSRRYFLPLKNNLGSDDAAAGLAYSIEEFHLADSDPPIITSRIMWEPELVTQSADELMNTEREQDKSAVDDAEDYLRDALSVGWTRTAELQLSSRKAGHSWATICRAKTKLKIKASRQGGIGTSGAWGWELPTPSRGYADRDR